MRELKSTQRRRRLRIIKAKDVRAEERIRSAASAQENNSNLQKSRESAELNRQRLAAECGAKLPTRFRVEHPAKESHHFQVNRAHLLIGSDPSCDLQLDHDAVHPHHGSLQWIDGHLFYCDLAPRTGNEPVAKSNGHWVDDQPIAIGPFQLIRDGNGCPVPPNGSPLDRSPLLSAHVPQLALQFLGVEQSDNKWPINRLLTVIGRGSQCKLRLNHPSMPHVQACLLRMKDSCWLIDVERAGTTGVNGRAIRMAPIGIGDVLQLGPFRVEVVATTFAPIKASPQPSPPQEENPARNNVKLFAPSTSDLGLPNRTGSRKSSPPPKSPSLVESSDSNSALTEISKNNSGGSPKKRPAPATTILDSGRATHLKAPNRSVDPTVHPDSTAANPTSTGSTVEKPSIAFSKSTYRPDEANLTTPADPKGQSVLYEAPKDVAPVSAAEVISATPQVTVVSVDDFIRGHQLQLVRLQSNLDQLKQICDRPSRHSISKRVRSQLEKSIQETIQTRNEMQESFANFMKSVEG